MQFQIFGRELNPMCVVFLAHMHETIRVHVDWKAEVAVDMSHSKILWHFLMENSGEGGVNVVNELQQHRKFWMILLSVVYGEKFKLSFSKDAE